MADLTHFERRLQSWLRLCMAAGAVALLSACASAITTRVTSFNQWPQDAAESTFSFSTPTGKSNDLEQAAYQSYVQAELERVGFRPASPGQVGRMQVEVDTSASSEEQRYREPVYQDYYTFRPPYRDAAGNIVPGYWVPDVFSPRYVGDREVIRTVYVSNLRLRLLDSKGAPPGKPRAVFEARSVYEGGNRDLPNLVPYLVRAVFDNFPGQNGSVRLVRFDPKTGAVLKN